MIHLVAGILKNLLDGYLIIGIIVGNWYLLLLALTGVYPGRWKEFSFFRDRASVALVFTLFWPFGLRVLARATFRILYIRWKRKANPPGEDS